MRSRAVEGRPLWDEPDDDALAQLVTRPDLPAGFERWQLTLAAGARRHAGPNDRAGTLVLVERGRLEVDCAADRRARRRPIADVETPPRQR